MLPSPSTQNIILDLPLREITAFVGILVAEASLLACAPPMVPLAGSALLDLMVVVEGRRSVEVRSVEP